MTHHPTHPVPVDDERWSALRPEARSQLHARNYKPLSLPDRLRSCGATALEAAQFFHPYSLPIPGVVLSRRTVHHQPNRGCISELWREGCAESTASHFPPAQWTASTIFSGCQKGFHVHPPNPSAPATGRIFWEQWEMMFLLSGRVELLLVDERRTNPRDDIRLFFDGDSESGDNHFAVIIPPGVAHAIRAIDGRNAVLVYATSTTFDPRNEGRLACGPEHNALPPEWEDYIG